MFIREFKCEQCGTIQEVWLDKSDHLPKYPCEHCGAPQNKLKKELSAHPKHVSWSTWNNLAGV